MKITKNEWRGRLYWITFPLYQNPHTTQMFCFFQSTIFSFSGGGGGPEKSTPNAFFACSRNFMAHGWFEVAYSFSILAMSSVSILTTLRSGAPLPGGLRWIQWFREKCQQFYRIRHVLWYYRFPVQTSLLVLILLEDKEMLSNSLPIIQNRIRKIDISKFSLFGSHSE